MNKNNSNNSDQKRPHTNFLESRICSYEKERSMFCGTIGKYYTLTKHMVEEEANCWIELSSLVYTSRALGFPLVYGSYKHSNGGRTIYFEVFKDLKVRRLVDDDACIPLSTVFQIVGILYCLYKRGIFSDCFVFDLVSIPRTMITISIGQLVFSLNTNTLVILSLTTRLYRAELPQDCYLGYVTCRANMIRNNLIDAKYFFEWLIRNHFDMIIRQYLDLFKTKKKYITTNHIHRFTEPGTLVYILRDDIQLLGVTITDISINDYVRVIFSPDGGNCVFEIDDFPITEVFSTGELITRASTVNICM